MQWCTFDSTQQWARCSPQAAPAPCHVGSSSGPACVPIPAACNLPLKATRTYKGCSKQEPGQLVIVNLQRTQVMLCTPRRAGGPERSTARPPDHARRPPPSGCGIALGCRQACPRATQRLPSILMQHDNKATKSGGVVCHARCDEVMAALAAQLGLEIPPYERRDAVVVGHQQHASSGGGGSRGSSRASNGGDSSAAEEAATGSGSDSGRGGGPAIPFSVFVQSSHGPKCAMPMVQAVDFEFEVGCPSLLGACCQGGSGR